jgi:hypothetical protein
MTPERNPEPEVSVRELRRQQQAETSGIGTPGQWHGVAMGGFVGGVVGGLVLFVAALVLLGDGPGLVVLPLIGLAFGAVAGAVYEGGRNPEREGELTTADGEPDPSTAVEGTPSSDTEGTDGW